MHVDVEKEEVQEKGQQQESQVLTDGLGESSNTPSKSVNPWSGRLRSGSPNVSVGSVGSKIGSVKGKEKVDVFDAGHSSGDESLDEEFGIPAVCTPRVQRVQDASKEVRRSSCIKYRVQRLRYDSLSAHHYAYMVNVV